MKVKAYRNSVGFNAFRDVKMPFFEAVSILEEGLKKFSAGKGFSLSTFLEPSLRRFSEFASVYDVHLVLEYPDGGDREVSGLYADVQSVNFDFLREHGFECFLIDRFGDRQVQLNSASSSLWSPLDIWFHDNSRGKYTTQQNKLDVRGYFNPGTDEQTRIRELATREGCAIEMILPTKEGSSGRFPVYSLREEGIHRTDRAPEAILRFTWGGKDFDKKAVHLFGEALSVVYENHLATVREHIEPLLRGAYGGWDNPPRICLSNERRNEGVYVGDVVGHMECHVPFDHGGKSMEAGLFYNGFRGR